MEEKHLTCISCPIGCYLTVKLDNGEVKEVSGNLCNRGITYAKMESTNPVRMMTSTVRIHGAALDALPVKSARPVPKDKVVDCVRSLKWIDLEAPVKMGDVVLANVCDTGVDVIATRSMDTVRT